ncbi:MAG TPA: hypothetical protein PKM41_09110 [Deltaproteobacteria bacterium]|nr:hypothetical protein [Deltaproteobacteria bacterium]
MEFTTEKPGRVVGKSLLSPVAAVVLLVLVMPLFARQAQGGQVYIARLETVNGSIAGNAATGTARIRMAEGRLQITVNARGLPPDTMIISHIHGLPEGQKAHCAAASADTNRDGFIDAIEYGLVTGPALVPLNDHPAGLKLGSTRYPRSDGQGRITYRKTVRITELMKNLKEETGMTMVNLDSMVIDLHGVGMKTPLPDTVQSELDLPACQTIPVACGEIGKTP